MVGHNTPVTKDGGSLYNCHKRCQIKGNKSHKSLGSNERSLQALVQFLNCGNGGLFSRFSHNT